MKDSNLFKKVQNWSIAVATVTCQILESLKIQLKQREQNLTIEQFIIPYRKMKNQYIPELSVYY